MALQRLLLQSKKYFNASPDRCWKNRDHVETFGGNLPCRAGWVLFLFYIGAFWFYFYVRVDKTLNLGKKYTWYGIVLLCVECMGATTVVIYGINLLYNPVHESFPDDERQPGCPKVNAGHTRNLYHQRLLFMIICGWAWDLRLKDAECRHRRYESSSVLCRLLYLFHRSYIGLEND